MSSIDLSIVLVNWNALELTSAALTSIKKCTNGIAYEVFVVDNGTTRDASISELPTRFPWIEFISNPENLGFSKANNQGVRRAKGRYILLLNNDTVQTGNALGESVHYMDAHPEVGALGISHLNNDAENSQQPSYFSFPQPWLEAQSLVGLHRQIKPAQSEVRLPAEADVDWICGSFLLMRRECMQRVGELDERFFIYDEDVDWCLRAHQAGWKVRFWSGASMIHVGSAAKPFMKDKTFLHFRSHLSFYHKHYGFMAAGLYYIAMGIRLIGSTAWQFLKLITGKGSLKAFQERLWRQFQFLTLRPGKSGG